MHCLDDKITFAFDSPFVPKIPIWPNREGAADIFTIFYASAA